MKLKKLERVIMNKTKRTEAEQQALLAYLREHYEYEPVSGRLRNKRQGTVLKPQKRGTSNYNAFLIRFTGKIVTINIHRAVWAVCKGEWPEGTIDHLNNNPKDNHIENLRECSQGDNLCNVLLRWKPNAITGVPGVWQAKRRFRCRIRGKRYSFSNPYEAFFHATLCGKRYRDQ